MMLARRRFLSLFPAPLIVSVANIMPVKALRCGTLLPDMAVFNDDCDMLAPMHDFRVRVKFIENIKTGLYELMLVDSD